MQEDIKNQNLSEIAVENSGYTFLSSLIMKFGGLIFTIIIARVLLPELFGVYSLVLSIITLFMIFANFGLDDSFLRYLSLSLGKKKFSQARSYFKFFFKMKITAVLVVVILIAVLAKLISYNLYENPLIFYPLLFSCLFLMMESFWGFFSTFFLALKELKITTTLNLFLQILKISFSLLALAIFSDAFKVSGLFIAFFFSEAIILFTAIFIIYKKNKNFFFGDTSKIDKSKALKFLKFMGIANISLVLLISIDTLMLGKFVALEYLGYYRAASSLVLTVASLASLSAIFLPIFTQIRGKRFDRGFHKTLRYLLIFSIPATAGVCFIANYLIKAIYGNEYLLGATPLYFLSFLIITTPLVGLYSTIFQSKEKSKIVSDAVLISLGINILLNILAIILFKNNPIWMISGVGLSVSLSRILLLGILIFKSKKEFGFRVKGIGLRAPIIATLIMASFLFAFNYLVDMNFFFGIIEVIIGAGIYLLSLILLRGINKEDWDLLKNFFRKN